MRSALFSLLLMLAAAVLVMVGGERMARIELETRTPLDRDRLFDFDQALRAELGRLDVLYQSHLGRLTETFSGTRIGDLKPSEVLSGISGVLRIQVFHPKRKMQVHDSSLRTSRLPEVLLGDDRRAFDPRLAMVLEKDFDPATLPAEGLWRETPADGVLLHLLPGKSGGFVAIFIERAEVNAKTREHLSSWLESPISPLRESGERVRITDPAG